MRIIYLVYYMLVSLWMLSSCEREESEDLAVEDSATDSFGGLKVEQLEGVWVEKTDRLDTIFCDDILGGKYFLLGRGKQVIEGHIIPKRGAGLWKYQINPNSNSISLNYLLSSNSRFNNYYFKIGHQMMKIGNFYNSAIPENRELTFVKLE